MSSASNQYSLFELCNKVADAVRVAFPKFYWVHAEIASYNLHKASGHVYLSLVEKDGNKTKAQLNATIWSANSRVILTKFKAETGELLAQNMHVLLQTEVRFHPQYGMSLNIVDIDPVFTLGQMAKQKLQAIKHLKASGQFDLNRSLTMPVLPKRIAVISVESSKGYQDFCGVLERFEQHYRIEHELFPAILQGENAVTTIREALIQIFHRIDDFDLVTIIRGGGGEVGLSAFDHVHLATAVARFPLPVLSGIGHAQNETVVDMVSFRAFMTPTDLGNFILSLYQQHADELNELQEALSSDAGLLLSESRAHLAEISSKFISSTQTSVHLEIRLVESQSANFIRFAEQLSNGYIVTLRQLKERFAAAPERKLEASERRLEKLINTISTETGRACSEWRTSLSNTLRRFLTSTQSAMYTENQRLENRGKNLARYTEHRSKRSQIELMQIKERFAQIPRRRMEQAESQLLRELAALKNNMRFDLQKATTNLNTLEQAIDNLNPSKVLSRGYSITRLNNRAIRDQTKVKKGELIETELFKGKLNSRVE